MLQIRIFKGVTTKIKEIDKFHAQLLDSLLLDLSPLYFLTRFLFQELHYKIKMITMNLHTSIIQ